MEEVVATPTVASSGFTLLLGLLLLVLPRRYALAPLLVSGCYLTLGQAIVVAGLHFYLIRIIILFGVVRVFVRGEIFTVTLTSVDKLLLAWLIVSCFLYLIFGEVNVVVGERLGRLYDSIGIYFLVRSIVRDLDDVVLNVKIFSFIVIPLGVFFVSEYFTETNAFSALGGVPPLSEVRGGRVRCQGPFLHSILAGTFGASAVPLFVGLWVQSNGKRLVAAGAVLTSSAIVFFSGSSGPLLAYFAVVIGLLAWPFRSHLRGVRWGILILVFAMHVFMEAPVWFLISRAGEVLGGGGWYRSALIDAAITHFEEWWLIGTGYTAHWMPTGLAIDPYMADMVNYFVAQGVRGGILALILFVWLIVKCFKTVGAVVRDETYSVQRRFMVWCLGCSVLGHVTSFFSVSYFDQITIFWYLSVAFIAALIHTPRVQGARKTRNVSSQGAALRSGEWVPVDSKWSP